MRLGTFSPSVLLGVARRSGALERHGVGVEAVPVASSPAQFRALQDGGLDAALTSPDNVVAYRFLPDNPVGRTLDVRIVTGVDRGLGLGLYARTGLATAQALRGRVVGVDVATSGFAFGLYEILTRAGLRAGLDYDLVELGSDPRRLDALLEGRCDATMLNAGSDLRAEAAGLPCIARVTDVAHPYLGTVLAVAGPPSGEALALAAALLEAGAGVLDGSLLEPALEELDALGFPAPLAARYAGSLQDPSCGVAPRGGLEGLETVVALRRRHAPAVRDGADLLGDVLDPGAGLVDRGAPS